MLIHFCVKKTVVRLCLSSASHSAPPSYLTCQLDSPAFAVLLDDSEAQLIKGAYSRPLICQDVYIQVPLCGVAWVLVVSQRACWSLMVSCDVSCVSCFMVSCGVSLCLSKFIELSVYTSLLCISKYNHILSVSFSMFKMDCTDHSNIQFWMT